MVIPMQGVLVHVCSKVGKALFKTKQTRQSTKVRTKNLKARFLSKRRLEPPLAVGRRIRKLVAASPSLGGMGELVSPVFADPLMSPLNCWKKNDR